MPTKYPSIPTPDKNLDSLYACAQALQQAVNLLIVNAQPPTGQNLTKASQSFAQAAGLAQSVAELNGTLKATTQTATEAAAAAAIAAATAGTAQSGVNALNPVVGGLTAIVGANFGLQGSIVGSVFNVTGVTSLTGAPYSMVLPGGDLAPSSVTTDKIANNACSQAASATSAGNSVSVPLTPPDVSDALIWASYTGTGIATPAGTGTLIITVDGVDHTVMPLVSAGGVVLATTGFFRAVGISAAAHTFAARAEFSTGPTDLNGLAIMVLVLTR